MGEAAGLSNIFALAISDEILALRADQPWLARPAPPGRPGWPGRSGWPSWPGLASPARPAANREGCLVARVTGRVY